MSAEGKKTADEGRFSSPTAAAAVADPAADLLGEVARGVGQRGPGRRSQEFVNKIASAYGMLPGDLLAATLMKGLRRHVDQGGDPGDFLEERAIDLANRMQTSTAHAMSMLMSVAHELMPYVHQKQPMAVELDQRSITFVVSGGGQAAASGGPGGLDLRPADVREKPAISMDGPARSDGAGRMDAPNTLKKQEE